MHVLSCHVSSRSCHIISCACCVDGHASCVPIAGSDRTCVTAVATVIADGRILDWLVIKGGKTPRALAQFSPRNNIKLALSGKHSHFMNGNVMLHYLRTIIIPDSCSLPSLLLLDCYNAHLTEPVMRLAHQHNIHIVTIPSTCTSSLSPLDVGIFGMVRALFNSLWSKQLNDWYESKRATPRPTSTLNNAVSLLESVLPRITSVHVKRAWQKSLPHILSVPTPADCINLSLSPPPLDTFHWVDPTYNKRVRRHLSFTPVVSFRCRVCDAFVLGMRSCGTCGFCLGVCVTCYSGTCTCGGAFFHVLIPPAIV